MIVIMRLPSYLTIILILLFTIIALISAESPWKFFKSKNNVQLTSGTSETLRASGQRKLSDNSDERQTQQSRIQATLEKLLKLAGLKKDTPQEATQKAWKKLPESVQKESLSLLLNTTINVTQRMQGLERILKPYGGTKVFFNGTC